jgi:acetoin utilization protein AcuC
MRYDRVLEGDIPANWLAKWQQESPVPLPDTWHDGMEAFPNIPRKKEIEEKNFKLLESALKYANNRNPN